MAIESKVQLQDSMTIPLLKIIDSLNIVISTFEKMDNMNVNIDTTGLENAQKQAQEAGAALQALRTDVDNTNGSSASVNVDYQTNGLPEQNIKPITVPVDYDVSDTPSAEVPPVQVPVEWETPDSIDVFTNSGVERFEQEIQSANNLLDDVVANQQRISVQASSTSVFPDNMVNDIQGMDSRVTSLFYHLQNISNQSLDDLGGEKANNELEKLRSQLQSILTLQDSLNSAMDEMDVGSANISYTRLRQIIDSTERQIRDNISAEDKLTDAVQKTTQSAENMKSSFSGIGTTIMGLSLVQNAMGMVKGQMDSAINRMDTMTNYSRTMTAITGNAQAAAQSLNTMKDATKGTAYGLDTAASSVQGFVTRGLTLGQATNQVSSWMDAVSFYGDGTNETLANVTDALGKMLTKGKVEMDQLDRLTDAGINAVGIYAQATGQSTADVQAALSKGKISAQQFVGTVSDAFENGKNGVLNISGAAKKAGGTWATSIANMKAAVTRGIISITDNINTALTDNGFPTLIEMVQMFGSTAETVMGNVGTVIGNVINFLSPAITLMKNIGSGIADNWSIIAPIVLGVATSFLILKGATIAYKAVLAITNILQGISNGLFSIWAAHVWLASDATFAATASQWGFNAALLACPITWIVLAFVALVAIIFAAVGAVNAFTGSSISALGVIAGGVVALGAIIVNIFKAIWNLGVDVVQFIVNAWNMGTNEIAKFIDTLGIGAGTAFSAIQRGAASAASVLANMFIGGANQAIKAVNWLVKAINKIPGIDIDTISEFGDVSFDFGASNTDKWTNGLENDFASRLANGASTVDLSGYKAQYTNISDAYQTGYNWGKNAQNTIGSKISNALNPKTGATDTSKLANTADASNLANTAGNTAKTAKNTKDTSKALKATSEDLKYIKDLAERDTINKFTTASINVSMNNNNTITKEMDIDVFTKHFTTKIEEQMAKASKGVY